MNPPRPVTAPVYPEAKVIQIEQERQAKELDGLHDEDRALGRMIQSIQAQLKDHILAAFDQHESLKSYFDSALEQRTTSFFSVIKELENRINQKIDGMGKAIIKASTDARQRDNWNERKISETEKKLIEIDKRASSENLIVGDWEAERAQQRLAEEQQRAEAIAAREWERKLAQQKVDHELEMARLQRAHDIAEIQRKAEHDRNEKLQVQADKDRKTVFWTKVIGTPGLLIGVLALVFQYCN